MRVEPFTIGSYVHVLKRGARGLPITKDKSEQWRFVRLLYYMNDVYSNDYWERDTEDLGMFSRPTTWPERKPLVEILAWTLMPNHFHLILKEIKAGGISKFMQKLGGSMSVYANLKHNEKGSLFQGSYKGRTIIEDRYLRYLASYIMVKNVFELYPGGFKKAQEEFNLAWKWAIEEYKFSSMMDYAFKGKATTEGSVSLIDKDILGEIFKSPNDFQECSRDMVLGTKLKEDEEFQRIALEV